MLINVSKRKTIRFLSYVILLAYILNVNASTQSDHNGDDEEILDIGVRLTRENHDSLIADLIAEEKEVLNAGHVNDN